MGALQIFKRLIWKESRESLLIIAPGAILPALLFGAKVAGLNVLARYVLFLLAIGILVWAAQRAVSKRNRSDFERAFVLVSSAADWTASFIFPAFLAAVLGGWIGFCTSTLSGWSYMCRNTLVGALALLSGFLMCYVTSKAFTLVFGLLSSLLWMLPISALWIELASPQPISGQGQGLLALAVRASIGAVIGSALLLIWGGEKTHGRTQILPFAVAVAACFGPYAGHIFQADSGYAKYVTNGKSSPDGAVIIAVSPSSSTKSVALQLMDYRGGVRCAKSFNQALQIIGLTNRCAYLAEQDEHERDISVLAWDIRNNTTRVILRIPTGRRAMLNYQFGAVSPDGRYVLFSAGSSAGTGRDLWAVDTSARTCSIVVPNTKSEYRQAIWQQGRTILSGSVNSLDIKLTDFSARAVDFPIPTEER